jgi:hypothetical protein
MADKNLTEIIKDRVDSNLIGDGQVDTVDIADDAVTNAKIGPLAVDTTEIATGAVTTDKIDTGAVDTDNIASNAVTEGKLTDEGIALPGYKTTVNTAQVRNIAFSTSEPTGGTDGDVWIQYSL